MVIDQQVNETKHVSIWKPLPGALKADKISTAFKASMVYGFFYEPSLSFCNVR